MCFILALNLSLALSLSLSQCVQVLSELHTLQVVFTLHFNFSFFPQWKNPIFFTFLWTLIFHHKFFFIIFLYYFIAFFHFPWSKLTDRIPWNWHCMTDCLFCLSFSNYNSSVSVESKIKLGTFQKKKYQNFEWLPGRMVDGGSFVCSMDGWSCQPNSIIIIV